MVDVTLGMDADEGVIIESGVDAGDLIIVDGVSRVQPGAILDPRELEGANDSTPSEPESIGPAEGESAQADITAVEGDGE